MGAMNLTGVETAATVTVDVTLKVNVDPRTIEGLRTIEGWLLGDMKEVIGNLADGVEAAMDAYQDQMAKDAEGYEGYEE